jgi:ADP-heptose:LPS heptosyltransferase
MCAAPIDPWSPAEFGRRLLRLARGSLTRCLPEHPAGEPRQHFRAVIFKVDRIGDFVLAVGAIRVVLREWGEENCLLVVSPLTEALVAVEFPRTRRIVLPPFVGHVRLFAAARVARRALAEISCDVVIGLRHQRWDFDELSLSWLHAKRIHVLEDVARQSMFAERRTYSLGRATRTIFREEPKVESNEGPQSCRELLMHRQLLAVVLGRTVAADEVLPRLQLDPPQAMGPVIFSPLGSHVLRDLPPSCLAAAVAEVQRAGLPAVLVGNSDQAARLAELVAALRTQGFDRVSARTDLSLVDFVRALAAAPLVVTTESAAAHLATALDRPVVAILGGGHFGQFAPWRRSARQTWLTKRMDCFGCNWRCIHPEPFCVTGVLPEAVATAVAGRLSHGGAA